MPLQVGSLDVTDQLHAVCRHAQAGEFVLSRGLLIGRRSAGQPLDLVFQGRAKVAVAHLHAARRQAHVFQLEFIIRIQHRALPRNREAQFMARRCTACRWPTPQKGNKDRSHVGIPAGSLSSWQQTLDRTRTLPETFPADEQYCTATWSPKFHDGSVTAQTS